LEQTQFFFRKYPKLKEQFEHYYSQQLSAFAKNSILLLIFKYNESKLESTDKLFVQETKVSNLRIVNGEVKFEIISSYHMINMIGKFKFNIPGQVKETYKLIPGKGWEFQKVQFSTEFVKNLVTGVPINWDDPKYLSKAFSDAA